MTRKRYDSTPVPVPRSERVRNIVFAAACVALGIFMMARPFIEHRGDYTLAFYGALVLGVSLFFLAHSMRTTRPQLTANGQADKDKDDAIKRERVAKREAAFTSCFFLIAVIVGLVYAVQPVSNTLQDRARVYFVHCAKWDAYPSVCSPGAWEPGVVATFSVHASQQFVVLSTSDPDFAPVRLANCAVVDRLNWVCASDADKEFSPIRMNDGQLSGSALSFENQELREVDRLRWWSRKLDSWIK